MNFQFFKKAFEIKKWPARHQWGQFFKILSKKEKVYFFLLFVVFISSFIYLLRNFYLENTTITPAQGGIHIEGVIGQPRFINPIYANSDTDRDLVQLIFSGLMKYDDNMNIVPDMVQNYEIEEEGKTYKFYLKENLLWQDKTPITSDDIIFTIKTIQNPDYKSTLRANWVGVEVEKISELGVKFKLKKPYGAFLENCTLKIIPKHILESIPPENFPFESYNLKPIGSGPYKIKEIIQEKPERLKSLTLSVNSLYYDKRPYIPEIKFLFFDNKEELIEAAKNGKVKGLGIDYNNEINQKWQTYDILMPRYFAVFFNPDKSPALKDKNVRIALNLATDKKKIIKNVLKIDEDSPEFEKVIVDSPILPQVYGYEAPLEIYQYDTEKAKEILEKAGFKDENGDGLREKILEKKAAFQFKSDLRLGSRGTEVEELQKCLAKFSDVYPEGEITSYFGKKTEEAVIKFQEKYASEILAPSGLTKGTGEVSKNTRAKLNEVCFEKPDESIPLKISLVTVNQAQLVEVAEELKNQWKSIGVELEIEKINVSSLEQDFIKPREYQSLLFGEVLGAILDLLPFWHSSQKIDPGLNLAVYQNKEADKLLEEIRVSSDSRLKAEKLNQFQNILIKEAPAVFLYCPDYIYLASKEIKGIETKKITDPSKRFSCIENWYIKTKRVWK
ncbi:MAG: ABC transporter substrate-binding protein [Candidatus Pacebacteria bacterium]|nr:ABC transporter substrate-binding protein [Candidatus Paceibacterota bacterium]